MKINHEPLNLPPSIRFRELKPGSPFLWSIEAVSDKAVVKVKTNSSVHPYMFLVNGELATGSTAEELKDNGVYFIHDHCLHYGL
jgi:hypothetical protein